MPANVLWLKRDLRLHDNPSLKEAVAAGKPLLVVYLFEPSLLAHPAYSERHWRFVWQSLQDLQSRLPAPLLIAHREALPFFTALHNCIGLEAVFSHQEVGLKLTYNRDLQLAEWFKKQGISWVEHPFSGVKRGRPNREG